MIKNLGQVAAIYVGKTAPRNVNMIWLDNTVIPYVFKSYNGEEWTEIPTGAWVETYVNGWLVSLQQGTVTTDDDYLLINSGGVNYKMTVKDFIKSSVGNPLDFRGVIRTDSDFPNPSTLEGGDMYIIITEPAGGTVTDPYSGKTFSDSEKIVWDSVINSWASLGKIDVKVDLSTTYSATEVTIHSSAGKETTVVGVTDDNAGVMVPTQKKWLETLSDGSTLTSQGPSTNPYHKHRYVDIVNRIISQQSTGDSTTDPMSQKATTEALDLKLDKASVLQVSGVSTTDVMSQKAVTDVISAAVSGIDLSKYALLAGNNTFSGSNTFNGTGNIFTYGNGTIKLNPTSGVEYAYDSNAVAKGYSIILGDADNLHTTTFGSCLTDQKYAYIALPGTTYSSAPYKFFSDTLNVPNAFYLRTLDGTQIIGTNGGDTRFGSSAVPNRLLTNNTDLTHRKYTAASTYTDYKIWDESNLPSPVSKSDLDAYATKAELGDYATKAWVGEQNYLTTASLDGYATEDWVTGKGYLTTSSLTGYAKESWVEEQGYLTDSSLTGYATESWVEGKNYLTQSSLAGYATETWVTNKGYLTSSSLDGYAKTTDLASYLPLAGGTLTGDLVLSNNNYIKGILSTGTSIQILGLNSSNTILVGNGSYNLQLYTGASDISHWKGGTSYKLWDAANVSRPLDYVNGTAGSVTSVYTRNLNLNGTSYPFIGTGTSALTLFAPTTAGTSGQVLQSQGTGKAPTWVDFSGGGVQLGDDNTWTGLNTFQGGLKTSDGTNSYDVWANDILKYPVKYEINSIGSYNFNYYTKTAGWRRIDQVAINNILPDTITSLANGGYGTLGLGTNAYESAAIADILTSSIYFEGLNARVLSTNSDGDLEYGSTTNYGDFNSRNIRIAYPLSSGGGGGGGGGSSTTYEGGLTISYYPINTKGAVTERAKIYCTTSNLYLKDIAKNTQLDFDTDGLYVTTGSTSKVRLATLNDVSGGGSSVSLDGNNTWTGVNIFSGTTLVTNQYDSGNTEIPSSAKYSIRLACGGSYNEYGFGAIRTEDRIKQSYSFVQTPSAFFIFDNSGSLYTTIGSTKYEFWNKYNLAKPVSYGTNTDGDAILYKGDITSKITSLEMHGIAPPLNDAVSLTNGGNGGLGTDDNAYAEAFIGSVFANIVTTTTIVVPNSENYFEFKEDGLYFYDIVNQEKYKINMTKV